MNFTAKEQNYLERMCAEVQVRVAEIQKDPTRLLSLGADESPHVWRRLAQLAAMSREDLQAEIEADFVLIERPLNREKEISEFTWEKAGKELESLLEGN